VFEHTSAVGGLLGLERRLGLKWIPADDGAAFVRAVSDFVQGLGMPPALAHFEH
jgi:hypothetical protein